MAFVVLPHAHRLLRMIVYLIPDDTLPCSSSPVEAAFQCLRGHQATPSESRRRRVCDIVREIAVAQEAGRVSHIYHPLHRSDVNTHHTDRIETSLACW